MRSDHNRFGNLFRNLRIHFWCIGIAGIFLGFSFFEGVYQCISSALLKESGVGTLALSIVVTFFGVVVPLLLLSWLYSQFNEHKNPVETLCLGKLAMVTRIFGYLAILGVIVILPIGFYLAELIIPFSVVPLCTVICGVLWICLGSVILRRLRKDQKLTLIAVSLCLILSVKFLDWNSRKSFERDLFRIKSGVTVEEVNNLMARYIKGTGLPYPYATDKEFEVKDSMIYRHSNKGAYYSDWGIVKIRDGKVEAVKFSPD